MEVFMYKIRKIMAAAVLAAWIICMPVLAAQQGNFLEGCSVEEGQLQIYCADIVSGEETAEECKITLGGQELEIVSAVSAGEQHIPITYYCLADVSGSMGEEQMSLVRETLLAVVDGLEEGDNMAVGTLGNQTDASGFLTDREELRQIINGLEASSEDTNLYAGIVESVGALETDMAVNPRKCLILLSDGEDDQKTGIGYDEAKTAVENTSIPIYTVAALRNASDEKGIENAKILGGFARMSTGGRHFTPLLDEITGKEAGESIVNGMEAGFTVSVSLSEKAPDKDMVLLRMVYTARDATVYEDTLELYTEDLRIGAEDIDEQESDPNPEPDPEPTPDSKPDPGSDPEPELQDFLPWLIGGAVVLLIVAVLVIALIKKRNNGTKEEQTEEQKGEIQGNTSYAETVTRPVNQPEAASGRKLSAESKSLQIPAYELHLYAIGYADIVRTLRLEQGRNVTVGRNGKADMILDSEDKKLSGVQCGIQWDGSRLYVWDMDSTNGTFVNGVPIKGMGRVAVHDGETIRIGSYEYRVGRRD